MEKRCSKCGQARPISEFHRSKRDGLQGYCKDCSRQYHASTKGRKEHRRYKVSEKGKAATKHYRTSEKGKEVQRRYFASEKGKEAQRRYAVSEKGRKTQKGVRKRQRAKYPCRYRAYSEVTYAIAIGKLPHISTQKCADCGTQAEEYHHSDYTKPLDVIPLCAVCHHCRHNEMISP